MKRVLIIGMNENPGGIESVIMNYYRNIDKSKLQFDFLCNTNKIAYQEEIKELGGNIYTIPSKRKQYTKYRQEIKRIFEENTSKYIAIWYNSCNLNNIDYLKYAKKYNIKHRIIHAHNSKNMGTSLIEKLYNSFSHNKNKYILDKYATDFWTCSEIAGQFFYKKNIRKSKNYKIINNAIDLSKFKYNEESRKVYRKNMNLENKIIIGNIGRLHFQKNQKFIIDIFSELCKKKDNFNLLLVGQGEDEEELKNKVKMLNLENRVSFLGVRKDVPDLLQTMDILLFPSIFEGLPVTLVEAEASGIDILTSIEAFPEETELSKIAERLSLNDKIDKWVEKLLLISSELHKNDRLNKSENNISIIRDCGYDIEIQAKKMQDYFINF